MNLKSDSSKEDLNPIDTFYGTLGLVWEKVTREFDVQAPLPDLKSLVDGMEVFDPCMAAEIIVRNMLAEVTQQVHRFSPWYKLPARAFGLIAFRDVISHQHDWRLAPEAILKWQDEIELIAAEIDRKRGLIQAVILIDDLDVFDHVQGERIVAVCQCDPPIELLVARKFLAGQEIVCNDCKESFLPIAG